MYIPCCTVHTIIVKYVQVGYGAPFVSKLIFIELRIHGNDEFFLSDKFIEATIFFASAEVSERRIHRSPEFIKGTDNQTVEFFLSYKFLSNDEFFLSNECYLATNCF